MDGISTAPKVNFDNVAYELSNFNPSGDENTPQPGHPVMVMEVEETTPSGQLAHERLPSWKVRWQLASACLMNFGNGMNDSAPGALIPYIETDYRIGYATMSLIFIANALGFIVAAPFTQAIATRLGRPKSYELSMMLLTTGYIINASHPPFAAVVLAFFLLGLGMSLSMALNNVFCANLANATTALGFFTGAYGMGGVISPLFATAMVSSGVRWNLFYTIPMGVSVLNAVLSIWAFRGFQDTTRDDPSTTSNSEETAATSDESPITKLQLLKHSIQNRTTLLGSLFIFAYQGAEVSVSGWVVSFLISHRDGDPQKVGYVSVGFWAGITLGRILLVYPANRFGEKFAVACMVLGSVGFQLMIWLIPNVIGEAVAVAILGLLLGAVFPCATAVFTKLLPRKLQVQSLSFVTAFGSSGGAVFPFLTGLIAQKAGTMVLHPICLSLYGVMGASWCMLPRISKRNS